MLGEGFAERRAEFEREIEGVKGKQKRRKEKVRAAERDEEEAFGDLSDEELLDLPVVSELGVVGVDEDVELESVSDAADDVVSEVEEAVEATETEVAEVVVDEVSIAEVSTAEAPDTSEDSNDK